MWICFSQMTVIMSHPLTFDYEIHVCCWVCYGCVCQLWQRVSTCGFWWQRGTLAGTRSLQMWLRLFTEIILEPLLQECSRDSSNPFFGCFLFYQSSPGLPSSPLKSIFAPFSIHCGFIIIKAVKTSKVGHWMISLFLFLCSRADVHGMVQLPPAESRHADREHRGGLQGWAQTHAAAGGHLRWATGAPFRFLNTQNQLFHVSAAHHICHWAEGNMFEMFNIHISITFRMPSLSISLSIHHSSVYV